jgi:hypothetical protein
MEYGCKEPTEAILFKSTEKSDVLGSMGSVCM